MSTKPSMRSRNLLDWLQALGETPVVNAPKIPWEPTDAEDAAGRAARWFVYGLFALGVIVAYWIGAPVGPPGFIYEAF